MEEEYNCEEEINLTPQDTINNMDWCKCRCECKLMVTFVACFGRLLRLKSRGARRASHRSAFMSN